MADSRTTGTVIPFFGAPQSHQRDTYISTPYGVCLPFPLDRRVAKVRRVAVVLNSKPTEKAKAAYWQQTVESLADRLHHQGVGADRIEREISQFNRAVTAELYRQAAATRR